MRTGAGLPELTAALTSFAREALVGAENALVTRARHRAALDEARQVLRPVLAGEARALELVAEDLRRATGLLEGIVGPVDSEDVLGDIFARFCIGK